MRLFHCASAVERPLSDVTAIQTPLGTVRLEVTLGERAVTGNPPDSTFALPEDARLACWHREPFDLELLVCRPSFGLQEGMEITDCRAGLWRLRAHAPLPTGLFAATWEEGYTWVRGGPASGEHLHAWEWDDGVTNVLVGTQDDERLAGRAKHGDDLPPGWEAFFRDARGYREHRAHQVVHGRGIATPVPALAVGEVCQVHFVVAWEEYDRESVSAWLAVDRSGEEILAGVPGCS